MKRTLVSLALCAALAGPPAIAQGQWGSSFTAGEARDAREKGEIRPLNEILRPIRAQYGGSMRQFVGLYDEGNRKVYIIDWVTSRGELVQFRIDAKTGEVLRVN